MASISRGRCLSIFAYDIGLSIDLSETERRLTSAKRETIRHKRRAPKYFDYRPAPLGISQQAESLRLDERFATEPQVDLIVYDFGAVSVIYRVAVAGDSSALLSLSERLYENELLLHDSRRRVEDLLKVIQGAVSKANISPFVEDYVIFQIDGFTEAIAIAELISGYAQQLAQILRAEARELSEDEVRDALSHRISFGKDDIVLVDWNAALVVDKDPEDILTILEFANVELLEMRFLDQRLDEALGLAYERLLKRSRKWFPSRSNLADLREISQWQVDSAILFEGVNNALKLLGDQYLARVYRLTAERFHLTEWDASILRKLETLESIYEKISDQVVSRRMEVMEWIIIILIAISIVLPFISSKFH
ncbi:MAG TPA: hypothetical protein VGK48_17300 [Terriglobia bacterium]|jgi:hypothetical protein